MSSTFQRLSMLLLLLLGVAAPARATFSLCAIDPATGEAGVIVTTRVPFVGRAVPRSSAAIPSATRSRPTSGARRSRAT
jgi:hypothetical protein